MPDLWCIGLSRKTAFDIIKEDSDRFMNEPNPRYSERNKMNEKQVRKVYDSINDLWRQLTLGEVIAVLEEEQKKSPGRVLRMGFGDPGSWRGDYIEMMVQPKADVTIDNMLQDVKGALGDTYYGYKGGEFIMTEYTAVWLDYYGESHEVPVSKFILKVMLEDKLHALK